MGIARKPFHGRALHALTIPSSGLDRTSQNEETAPKHLKKEGMRRESRPRQMVWPVYSDDQDLGGRDQWIEVNGRLLLCRN